MVSYQKRVKYYNVNDMSIGSNLAKAEEIILSYDEEMIYEDINDILELYNINLLFETKIKLEFWSDDYYKDLYETVKKFKSIIGVYCSEINYLKINNFYPEIIRLYHNTFWKMFVQYKLYNKLTQQEFACILKEYKIPLELILLENKIVKAYDDEINEYMQNSIETAEFLIRYHLIRKKEKFYLPSSLTPNDKITIIEKYIDSEEPHPNYLELLCKARYKKEFPISKEVRYSAQKRYKEYTQQVISNDTGPSIKIKVEFSDSEKSMQNLTADGINIELLHSRQWITENLDYPTLLNNYIHVFGYVDYCCRIVFPSLKNELGIFESIIRIKGDRDYDIGASFEIKEIISSMQNILYYYELLSLNTRVEDIFKWFFEEYLVEEFGVEGFTLSIPSVGTTFLEKIRIMLPELESILRQFEIYINRREVNQQMLQMDKNGILIENIPSFIQKKYGYIIDLELKNISYLLFSNQSDLLFIENKKEYTNFECLIKNEKITTEDFSEFQQFDLKVLFENKIIFEDYQGGINLNWEIVNILKDFYQNEVICISYYKNNELLNSLIKSGKISCESKLFSKPEQHYLNFKLNDREFDNGPSLRNKYLHGISSQDKEEHKRDYFELLKIFIVVIIKINEEFCLNNDKIDGIEMDFEN